MGEAQGDISLVVNIKHSSACRVDGHHVEVVLQTAFAGDECATSLSSIDNFCGLMPECSLRIRLAIKEMKFRAAQRREPLGPPQNLTTAERDKEQALTAF